MTDIDVTVPSRGCTLAQYAEAKRLPVDFLRALGLADMYYQSQPAVRIPYLDTLGNIISTRFRLSLSGERKIVSKSGSKAQLYGLWRLPKPGDRDHITIVEGESDTHTLWCQDELVVGIPGASVWREEWEENLCGYETIYVFIEPDQGGEQVLRWLERSTIRDRVKLIRLNGHNDPSALHIADPDGFRKVWEAAKSTAIPWSDHEVLIRGLQEENAWKTCGDLAREPDILTVFAADLARKGVVGEGRIAKLLYLAITSRFLDRPVSFVVKGPSSAGKSFLTGSVLKFFPDSAYYMLTGMSERALVFSSEPLKHRFLVVAEAAGLQGELASYLWRSLLSEGRLSYIVTEKSPNGGYRTRTVVRDGPTGLAVTTAALNLHTELETRLLSVPVTDTSDQTAEIINQIFNESEPDVDLERWHALQVWLEHADHRVTIPYGRQLAASIPPIGIRLRRDAKLIRNLIMAHAILHQAQRERDSDGQIVATLTDYRAIRELVADIVAEGIGAVIPNTIRETVEVTTALLGNSDRSLTYKSISEKLKPLDYSAARRRIRRAIELGYLRNRETRHGLPAQIVIGDPLPENRVVLPSADDLLGGTLAQETDESDPPPPHAGDMPTIDPWPMVGARLPSRSIDLLEAVLEAQAERAAIREFDGGLDRDEAERQAAEDILRKL